MIIEAKVGFVGIETRPEDNVPENQGGFKIIEESMASLPSPPSPLRCWRSLPP